MILWPSNTHNHGHIQMIRYLTMRVLVQYHGWWCPGFSHRHMMTSSHGNFFALRTICAGNSPVTGEFPTQKPVTRSFDAFFDLRLNGRLNKQSWGWWFETPSRSWWRHCNMWDEIICAFRNFSGLHPCLDATWTSYDREPQVIRVFV